MADIEKPLEPDCERARAEVHAFLAGTGVGAKSPALRAHLAHCPDCDAHYRGLVVGVARIAAGARVAAEVRHDDEIASNARRSLIAAETKHRIRLPRSLLPLAVVGLIVMLIAKSSAHNVTLRALQGSVFCGAEAVEPGESVTAANGAGCSTGPGGRAELARGDDVIQIEPESSFTIERTDRLAIRMFDGRASAGGSALILCTSGALEVQLGSAVVTIDDVGIAIESVRGTVEFSDAGGRSVIPPGTTIRLEHAHVTARR